MEGGYQAGLLPAHTAQTLPMSRYAEQKKLEFDETTGDEHGKYPHDLGSSRDHNSFKKQLQFPDVEGRDVGHGDMAFASSDLDNLDVWCPPPEDTTEDEFKVSRAITGEGWLARSVLDGHFRDIVEAHLVREKVKSLRADDSLLSEHSQNGNQLKMGSCGWLEIVMILALEAIDLVKPDFSSSPTYQAAPMHIQDYVTVKCVATGKPSDSFVVQGLVCRKNVADRHMQSKHKRPYMLLLEGALEAYEPGDHLASMTYLLAKDPSAPKLGSTTSAPVQEKRKGSSVLPTHIRRLKPNILLVEKTVSRTVQEELLKENITVVLNVKKSLLNQIAVMTGAKVASSAERLLKGGTCEHFHVERYVEEHCSTLQYGKKPVKNIMFFEGCPKTGCSVVLFGASKEELKKVKRVVKYAIVAAYHLVLEMSFLVDEGCSIPHFSPSCSFSHTYFSQRQLEQSRSTKGLGHSSGLIADSSRGCHDESAGCIPDVQDMVPGIRKLGGNNCVAQDCEMIGSTGDWAAPCNQDQVSDEQHLQQGEQHKTSVTDTTVEIAEAKNHLCNEDGFPLTNGIVSELSHQGCSPLMSPKVKGNIEFGLTADDTSSGIFPSHLVNHTNAPMMNSFSEGGVEEDSGRTGEPNNANAEETKSIMSETVPDESLGESQLLPGQQQGHLFVYEKMNPDSDLQTPSDPEMILLSVSSRNLAKGVVCNQPELLRIHYYGNNDVPVGRFLQERLFDPEYKCKECNDPKFTHLRVYTHFQGILSVTVRQLPTEAALPGAVEGSIWVWHRCTICEQVNGLPPATHRVLMSPAAWGLSLGKFFELSFSTPDAVSQAASCGHSLHRNCLRFFGMGTMVACFVYSPIQIRNIQLPLSKLEFNNPEQQGWILEAFQEVVNKEALIFGDVEAWLHLVSTSLATAANRGLLEALAEHRQHLGELSACCSMERSAFSAALEKAAPRDMNKGAKYIADILEINRLHLELSKLFSVWDLRLQKALARIQGQVGLPKSSSVPGLPRENLHPSSGAVVGQPQDSDEHVEKLESPRSREQMPDPVVTETPISTEPTLVRPLSVGHLPLFAHVSDSNIAGGQVVGIERVQVEPTGEQRVIQTIIQHHPPKDRNDSPVDSATRMFSGAAQGDTETDFPGSMMGHIPARGMDAELGREQLTCSGQEQPLNEASLPFLDAEHASTIEKREGLRAEQRAPAETPIHCSPPLQTEVQELHEIVSNGKTETEAKKTPSEEQTAGVLVQANHSKRNLDNVQELAAPGVDGAGPVDIANLASLFNSRLWLQAGARGDASGACSRDGVHLQLPPGANDTVIVVYEDEPTSIIAYAIASPNYQHAVSGAVPLAGTKDGSSGAVKPEFGNNEKRDDQGHQDDAESAEKVLKKEHANGSKQHPRPMASASFDHPPGVEESVNVKVYFTNNPSEGRARASPLGHSKTEFCVTSYYAKKFEALRDQCCGGVEGRQDFLRSLCRCRKWQAQGGKSNVYFAKTQDDRFIVKEVTSTELASFLKFAPEYFHYLSDALATNSPTCLAKILGIFEVVVKKGGKKETSLHLKIMENLLYGRTISRLYDLKGSLRSRLNKEPDKNKVLLDENLLMEMPTAPIFVGKRAKRRLQNAVWNDTAFLAEIGVMDYSLVAGIDEMRRELVVGIIDYIRQYTWDKHLETWVKQSGILGGPTKQAPTVISPKLYKKRFRSAMAAYFVMVPDQWTPPVGMPIAISAAQRPPLSLVSSLDSSNSADTRDQISEKGEAIGSRQSAKDEEQESLDASHLSTGVREEDPSLGAGQGNAGAVSPGSRGAGVPQQGSSFPWPKWPGALSIPWPGNEGRGPVLSRPPTPPPPPSESTGESVPEGKPVS